MVLDVLDVLACFGTEAIQEVRASIKAAMAR